MAVPCCRPKAAAKTACRSAEGCCRGCGVLERDVSSLISPTCTSGGPKNWEDLGCFLNATLLLGEESFYSVMSELPSSSSCLLNHRVGFCNQEGANLFHDTNRVEVVLSPVESEKLQLESPSVWTLCVVLVVAFANSRYVNKMKAFIVWPLALLGLLLCTLHAARTVVDLASCGATSRHHPVHWTQMEAHWADAQVALGKSRLTPSSGAQRVAEYCWVPPLPKQGKMTTETVSAVAEDDFQRQSLDINMTLLVRDMWISLMDSATFLLDFDNQSAVRIYCGKVLQMRAVSQCLRWMNNTELGNRITCQDTAQPQITAMELEGLMEAGSELSERQQISHLLQLSEKWQLRLLEARNCRAAISGHNFALRPPSLGPDVPGGATASKRHLLALLQGVETPRLQLEGPAGYLDEFPAAYLRPAFIGCVARIFHVCAGRSASATLTAFRSSCQAACALLMLLGYVRMLCIRIGCYRWWAEYCPDTDASNSLREKVQKALDLLSSRVGVGLLMASLLQVGFTVLANELAVNWIAEGHGVRLAEMLKLYPFSLIDVLLILSIRLQLAVFLLAVCYNMLRHVKLRRQILALPRNVLFGHGSSEVPESYCGPDLNDLKRMGRTSLVYAMYFPGIVFWHFFYASWILVLMFSFTCGCLVIVSQPAEVRSVHAQRIWPVLTYASFLCSVLLAHFVTRLFTQRCLLNQHGEGVQIRCLCLFSWYEVMLFLLSFAVGPTAALWDYFKGFLCTVLASLIIEKPNFTQFGELADYVYCTYCAALLLERMDRDRKDDSPRHHFEAQLETCQDLQRNCDRWDSKAEPSLLDQSYESKSVCFRRTAAFWLLFLGLPLLAAATVDRSSFALGYSCPTFLQTILPIRRCSLPETKRIERLQPQAAMPCLTW
ncbi:unnamed protein product [Cladocopium goreaui]|uniref:Uncharacterized protein n=1 Tax=Cladocopium goreaui TaxID=2562237 RepID=A0A9P1D6B1_9DINO|nr:unnamed protein product [Cladocopium goreaui]